jgi:hypothetical protein
MTNHRPPSNPAAIRAEISRLLDGIADNETLLFCRWMFQKIANNEPLPPDEQIKPLREAFIRVLQAVRANGKIRRNDWTLLVEYMDVGGSDIARPLATTFRHLRVTKGLTRRQVSRLSGFSVGWLIALERGRISDLSLPEFERLGRGLGMSAVGLMKELEKRLDFGGIRYPATEE